MMRVARLAAILMLTTLGACSAPASNATSSPPAPSRAYGQTLPDTFCKALDFNPIIKALNVGTLFLAPDFLNHGGTENQWYDCSLSTQRRDGPDQYRYAHADIRIELFGKASSAVKAFDEAHAELRQPTDFAADAIQRAAEDVQPNGCFILILDGNLLIAASATVDQSLSLAPAVKGSLEELARAVLAEVRRSAT